MHREVLRLKAAEGKPEELKATLMKLCELAAAFPGCRFSRLYAEANNPGWYLIDQEFDSKENLMELLQDEAVAPLDAAMKRLLSDGMSIVLEEIRC